MTPITTFFRNLESKCCAACGQVMSEQAESYMTECFSCQDLATRDADLYYHTKK